MRLSEKYEELGREWREREKANLDLYDESRFSPTGRYFLLTTSGLFGHPSYVNGSNDTKRKLELYHIYSYLEFLILAEQGIVSEVCDYISKDEFPYTLPEYMKDGALSIKSQEANHSLWAYSLMVSLEKFTNVPPLWLTPHFLPVLDKLIAKNPDYEMFIKLLMVILAEHIDFGTATRIISDPEVQEPIRDFAEKHEVEEKLHRVYFTTLLEVIWPQLNSQSMLVVAQVVPYIMFCFVSASENNIKKLSASVLKINKVDKFVHHLISEKNNWKEVRTQCRPTIEYFKNLGLLSDPQREKLFFENIASE